MRRFPQLHADKLGWHADRRERSRRRPAKTQVALLGALGVVGRIHANIYAQLGIPVIPIDPASSESVALDEVDWKNVLVDVCTPTASHIQCLEQTYALGARNYIVEKPAAADAPSWQACTESMSDAQIFVVHNYLFSAAFQFCRQMLVDPVEITTTFNKDRTVDDARGRGAGPDGHLPHVLQVEAPHQFAMLLAIAPDLAVTHSEEFLGGGRGAEPLAPVAATVALSDHQGRRALLHTDLSKPRERNLRVVERDGRIIEVKFPIDNELVSTVTEYVPGGAAKVLFRDSDDVLAATLKSAVTALRDRGIPWQATASFAHSVLDRIDQAINFNRAHQPAAN